MTGCSEFDCTAPPIGYVGTVEDGQTVQRARCEGHTLDTVKAHIEADRSFTFTPWKLVRGAAAA